ncbi:hypothetical protein [Acinetobacter sp. ANC 5414]|uniref:hypothetical protein n=1 Tax=Acinetobacter sp. ANC 5414 TaxID=2731251 RepID=UPI00148FB976|nr:hypothetical protein [Acinetobacter sp. ANC 5414]NNG99923.1 hypothetical protein [Acinetobacter sp. ANC 5414]
MTTIIDFSLAQNLEAQKNLEAFISFNKTNFIFPNNNWDDNIWDITNFLKSKISNTKSKKVYFRSVTENSTSKTKISIPISEPLLDFTKAVFCEIMREKKLSEYKRIIYTMQALEFALIDQKTPICVSEINIDILNLAESYLHSKYKDPWNIAKNLESIINNIIIKKQINKKIYNWSTTIMYTAPIRNDRTQNDHIEGSKSKIPHLEEILALADIHHLSSHIPDKLVTCFVALAMFAPSRGSEILSLPIDCITKAPQGDVEIMGIKWRPLKGGAPLTKFAVTQEYEELATDAVNYLIEIGKPARDAAQWYKNNPNTLYLPPHLEHLRNQPITLWEVAQILGKENSIKGCHAFRYGFSKPIGRTTDKSRMLEKSHWVALYNFEELEHFIIGKLPQTFPIFDGRSEQYWHDSLFIFPKNILNPTADSLLYVPEPMDIDRINKQLGSNPDGNTIFSRNNKKFQNKKPMCVTSHQFRHLLNTLAQAKALSQELIAFWSGRKSVKQNDVYNHLSQESIIEAFTELENQVEAIKQTGSLEKKVQAIAKINAIHYEEALKIELGSIHITQYGICRHDYSLTPCPKDKDCGNCGEFSVMKGNEKHRIEASYQVQLLEKALLDAKEAEQDGHTGAKRWIEVNEPKLERWQKIKAFLEDDSIPNNTMFTLADSSDYHQTKVGLAFAVRKFEQN